MGIKGNLKDMSLVNIIQVNCNERNQARLLVQHQGKEGIIFFEDGNIVHMTLDSQEGEEVIHELLNWQEGSFELEQGVPPPARTVTASWSSLLLEGMQRIDESMAEGPLEILEDRKEWKEDMAEDDLVRKLREVEGIAGAVIVARDGIVLAHDLEDDVEKEGAVAVFIGNAASQIGEALALGTFNSGVVEMGSKPSVKTLVLERPDYFVGLLLEEQASPALIASQAKGILK